MENIRLPVRNVGVSAAFYAGLLGCEAQDSDADHSVFATDEMRLELRAVPASLAWARQVDIVVKDATTVIGTYERLWDGCVRLPQIPTDLGFGLGFVALDPDGHRLRVLCFDRAEAA